MSLQEQVKQINNELKKRGLMTRASIEQGTIVLDIHDWDDVETICEFVAQMVNRHNFDLLFEVKEDDTKWLN